MNMSTEVRRIIIVGAGQGGYQVAACLRHEGYVGEVTLVGDEPGLPYQRPPLSKAYLQGEIGAEMLSLRPQKWFTEQGVSLRAGRAASIERCQKELVLADGARLPYDRLVLATGARNRPLPVEGADCFNVKGIRTLADADALMPLLKVASRVTVIGAGFIGLEFAAVAAKLGLGVDVIEQAARPMARAVSRSMAAHVQKAHEASGTRFHFGAGVRRIEGECGRATSVVVSSGERIATDLVVVGIGVLPNAELAAQAGLEVADGICVDGLMTTTDPAISAIGDSVSFPCVQAEGQRLRLESVQNAVDQARTVALALVGRPIRYSALPWFWSDQGDLKIQIAGLSSGHDRTVDLPCDDARQRVVLCFREGKFVAVETLNRSVDHVVARKLLARDSGLTADQAGAAEFSLKAYEVATR